MDVKWLRTLILSSLEKKRLKGNFIAVYCFLRRESGEEFADLFSLGSRMCGKGSKLHQKKFRLDIRKYVFTERMMKNCHRVAREVVDALCLSVSLIKRGIWTMTFIMDFNFWSALRWSGSWTR